MSKKRYSIVRVDHMCPAITEEGINICKTDKNCKNKCPYRYGDTKEQMILKVAQVLIKDEMKICQYKTEVHKRICWQNNMELAKEIVEFLGVEDDKEKERR